MNKVDNIFEELRFGQAQDDEVLRKRFRSYLTQDVDQYVEKLRDKMRVMENSYQQRIEEIRTNLLDLTHERDDQAVLINKLQDKLDDMPKYHQEYLDEQGLVAVQKEKYEQLSNIDLSEYEKLTEIKDKYHLLEQENEELKSELETAGLAQYEQLTEIKDKYLLLEQENKELKSELETAGFAQKDTQDALKKLEIMSIQVQTQEEQIEQQKAQLLQSEQAAQRLAQLENMETLSQSQKIELAQLQSQNQMLELQHKRALEMNKLLTWEKESLEKEAFKQKELWDAERDYLIQRFNGILNNQKQYMVRLKENITSSIMHLEKMNKADFLDLKADDKQEV